MPAPSPVVMLTPTVGVSDSIKKIAADVMAKNYNIMEVAPGTREKVQAYIDSLTKPTVVVPQKETVVKAVVPPAVKPAAPAKVVPPKASPSKTDKEDKVDENISKKAIALLPPPPEFKEYEVLTPDMQKVVMDITNENQDNDLHLYEWEEKYKKIVSEQEAKVNQLPARSPEKKEQKQLVDALKGFKDVYRDQLQELSYNSQFKTRENLLAEIKKRGITDDEAAGEVADTIGMALAEPGQFDYFWQKPFSYMVDVIIADHLDESTKAEKSIVEKAAVKSEPVKGDRSLAGGVR